MLNYSYYNFFFGLHLKQYFFFLITLWFEAVSWFLVLQFFLLQLILNNKIFEKV